MGKTKDKDAPKNTEKAEFIVVADIGGNSVKAQFFLASAPLVQHNDLPPKIREFCGLNGTIGTKGPKAKAARQCALTTLEDIADKIKELEAAGHKVHVSAVGTGPFRDDNGEILEATPAFIAKAKKKSGLDIQCISGDEEARLCAEAITARYGNVSGTILKMGGSTAEFILLNDGQPVAIESFPLGTLAIKNQDDKEAYIEGWLSKLPEEFQNAGPVFFMGGTPRALSVSFMELRGEKIPDEGEPILISGQRFLGHCETTTAFRTSLLNQKGVDIDDSDMAKALGVNNEERVRLMEYATLLFSQVEALNHDQDVVPVNVNMRHGLAMRIHKDLSGEQESYTPEAA